MFFYESHHSTSSEGMSSKNSKNSSEIVAKDWVGLVRYQKYRNFVAGELKKRKGYDSVTGKLVQYRNEFLGVFCVDLDGIHEKLRQLYGSNKVGKKP